jgi:hypothetical protein
MMRPAGLALSLQEDYVVARYPRGYKHSQSLRPFIIGESRHLLTALTGIHKEFAEHYMRTHKVHERHVIVSVQEEAYHITIAANKDNGDTLVLRR